MKELIIDNVKHKYRFNMIGSNLIIEYNGQKFKFDKISLNHEKYSYRSNCYIVHDNKSYEISLSKSKLTEGSNSNFESPMPGKILKVLVKLGQKVKKGDSLIVMEAMKMEHIIKSPFDGRVEEIPFKEQEQVSSGVQLISVKDSNEAS